MRRLPVFAFTAALFSLTLGGCSDGDETAPTPTATAVPTGTHTSPPTATQTPLPTITETPVPTPTATPTVDAAGLAAEGEAAFFDTLYGIENREQETISLLSAAVAANPAAGRSFFLLGMMHLYRASKNLDGSYDHPSAFVLAEAASAQTALDEAVPKAPEDRRIPGFRGAVTYLNGVLIKDSERQQLGLQQLRAAVDLYPDFNNFSFLGTVAPVVRPDDPLFLESLELVRQALVGGCTPDSQPRICGNAGKAPHNVQGAFILFGDMLTKAGRPAEALPYFQLALILPGTDTWPFRAIAQERIATVNERAALWADEDPTNDPRFVGNGPEACAVCHFR